MEIIAKSKHIRMSPRKLRLVVDSLRGLSVNEVMIALQHLNRRAVKPLLLIFKQAVGNAVNNYGFKKADLRVKEMQVGEGPTLKRWQAVSRGRARRINKRTSHLRIVLEGQETQNGKRKTKDAKREKKEREKDGAKS